MGSKRTTSGGTPYALLPAERRVELVERVREMDALIKMTQKEMRRQIDWMLKCGTSHESRNEASHAQLADTMGRVLRNTTSARADLIGAHPGLLAATADPTAGTSPADDLAALERAVEDDGAA